MKDSQYENKDANKAAPTKHYNITEKNINNFIYIEVKKLGKSAKSVEELVTERASAYIKSGRALCRFMCVQQWQKFRMDRR